MELKIIRARDDFLELEALDEDPAFFDSLSELIQKLDGVEYAGITIEHPLTKKIIMRVKTNPSKIKAVDAVKRSIQELKGISKELREAFEKL